MALSAYQQQWLEDMKRHEQEVEQKRLAYLASRTPEEAARDEEVRQREIETAARRARPVPPGEQANPGRIHRLNAHEAWDA